MSKRGPVPMRSGRVCVCRGVQIRRVVVLPGCDSDTARPGPAASNDESNSKEKIACVIKQGRLLLARKGKWRTCCIKTTPRKSSEQWYLWARKSSYPNEIKALLERVEAMTLSSEGECPFNNWSLSMREARHCLAGPYYSREGIVAATDGSRQVA